MLRELRALLPRKRNLFQLYGVIIWKMLSFRKVDSTPIHVTCKFARRYGKDCEIEVHVSLDFRMPAIISEMAVVLINW